METIYSRNEITSGYSQEELSTFIKTLPTILECLAEPHIGGRIQLLENNPNKYMFQNPLLYQVAGTPIPLDQADTISPVAQKGYLEERNRLFNDPEVTDTIENIGKLVKKGKNIVVITPHDQLIDIVMALLVIRDMLLLAGQSYEPKSTSIILSKMVTRIQYTVEGLVIPAIDVIKLFCDDIYLSFPKTNTSSEKIKNLPESLINRNNSLLTSAISHQFYEGGALLGLAATGTTRRTLDDKTGRMKLSEVNSATANIMTSPKTYCVGILASVDSEFKVNYISQPTCLKNTDEVNVFMDELGGIKPNIQLIKSAVGSTAVKDF